MTQGDIIHGFRLLRKYPSGDFKGTLYAFEHEKSRAQVFWFSNGDTEAMGVIGVRTPAFDDTGVAHVLEHMLLRITEISRSRCLENRDGRCEG